MLGKFTGTVPVRNFVSWLDTATVKRSTLGTATHKEVHSAGKIDAATPHRGGYSAWADAYSPTSRPTTSANAISTDAHASAAAVDADLFVAVPVTASTATAAAVSAIFLYAHARSIAAIISRGVRPR